MSISKRHNVFFERCRIFWGFLWIANFINFNEDLILQMLVHLSTSVCLSIYQHHLSSFLGNKRHKKKTKTNETIKSRDIHENSWKSLKFIPQKFRLFKMHASDGTKRLLHFVSGSLSVFLAVLDTFHIIGKYFQGDRKRSVTWNGLTASDLDKLWTSKL